ncbi:MAG: Nif3-like dinuclear metal center hexameric protein [Traorella sp.]
MQIIEAIEKVKKYYRGTFLGKPIDLKTTRDKILWGNPNQELTGIVTCIYPSVDVIRKAIELNANFIITHEACFWNHGDHTDWLTDNKTFQMKTELLDSANICVWRNHDFIHSCMKLDDGRYTDGIFYGFMKKLNWDEYLIEGIECPVKFELPETTVGELTQTIKSTLDLNGVKVIGSLNSKASRVWICGHIDGRADNDILKEMEEKDFDTLITLECTDYTVAEYVRDSTMLGRNKTIIALGHFNQEEPGMEYMTQYLHDIVGKDVPCTFVKTTDMFEFQK